MKRFQLPRHYLYESVVTLSVDSDPRAPRFRVQFAFSDIRRILAPQEIRDAPPLPTRQG